ncbi:hypothetical protein [Paenibacillus sp.]|uniref:hypothetical protein n=1 Tax=Paenibacillus sp. TaxID=58172 RepID=UPI0028118259|nr:hypothetical protein [Paenibacillus sp.]
MLNVENCKGCGKLILRKPGHPFCPACAASRAEEVRRIKHYVLRHPSATILDIHRNAGIPLKAIHELIREDRVQLQ